MSSTTIRAALALTACLLAAPAVLAQAMPPGFDDRPAPGGAPFLRGLALTEAQQDRVFAIMHEQAPRRRELDKAERKACQALDALSGSAELDQAAAGAQARALGQAIADQELLRLRTEARLIAVLTSEQRAQLQERRARRERGPRGPQAPQPGTGEQAE